MEDRIRVTYKIRIAAVDFDGVITNLNVDWNIAIKVASTITGYDVKSLTDFYQNSFGSQIFQKVSLEVEKLEMQALKTAQPTPFVKDFLRKTVESGISVYVVSMQSAKVVEEFLHKHGLRGYCKGVITREMYPSREAQIAYILKEEKINPNELLLIDDSKRNITICLRLGVICFHFLRRQDPSELVKTWNSILNLMKVKPIPA